MRINRAHLVEKAFDIPISLCRHPPPHLRSRYNLLDEAHVKKLKQKFIANWTDISSWIAVVFGDNPDTFRMGKYEAMDKVCLVSLRVVAVLHYFWSTSSCSQTTTFGGIP